MQQVEVVSPGHGAASLLLLHAASKDPASLLRALPSTPCGLIVNCLTIPTAHWWEPLTCLSQMGEGQEFLVLGSPAALQKQEHELGGLLTTYVRNDLKYHVSIALKYSLLWE